MKIIIGLLLIGLIFSGCNSKTRSKKKSEQQVRPNIILVMCDDLGWGDTGFNGNEIIQTPNLDMLAGKGLTFTRFYSASAVCSPTRGSCLTGRNPYRYGIPGANSGKLKKEEITISELLKESGYRTGHFGKWHLGTLTTMVKDANRGRRGDSTHYSVPDMHGYDSYLVTESKVPTYDPMIKPAKFDKEKGESLRYGWKAVDDKTKAKIYGTAYWKGTELSEKDNLNGDDSRVIMDRVIPFIESSVRDNEPFFTVIWFHTPHLPLVASEEMMAAYKEYSHQEQLLYASITGMDTEMGRLWNTLERLNQDENTMLWFCSDNGPEVGTPGSSGPFRERKRSLYEGGVRVPAFCVWPGGIEGGRTTEMPMVTSDYLPTIVDILGLDYPAKRPLDGISLKEVFSDISLKREVPIGFRYKGKMSWVKQQYKLISTDKGETFELYDLLKDRSETQDIASEHPELVVKMKAELFNWIESCDASAEGADYNW